MSEFLKDKRVLVTGVNGQVGRALTSALDGKCELIRVARVGGDVALDLTDFDRIQELFEELKPDVVINPAAYTQVDRAETEPDLAMKINGDAPGVIAEACKVINATLIHYSTDYVFNGRGDRPYLETDLPDPISVYGCSKLLGEQAVQSVNCKHIIFRTSWVYDAFGKNFPNAILNKAKKGEDLSVVDDQFGTPNSADFIAAVTTDVIDRFLKDESLVIEGDRIYHLVASNYCSWFEFAKFLLDILGLNVTLKAVASGAFPVSARRPTNSRLNNGKLSLLMGYEIEDWRQSAIRCFV